MLDVKDLDLQDISYLLGKVSEGRFLFIRDCYQHLANVVLNDEIKHNYYIIANLGIGKTYFSYYLLYQLAQRNKIVIYDERYYEEFEKNGYCSEGCMSMWSWEEVNICRHVNFNHLSQKKGFGIIQSMG
ncbi:hypothetical protein GLOIN_2v1820807 [Rhizophagus clarus]|uniref:Uncharacterized protein n=1 Tax=Rhizophagus clarus TaxID=94130 RepID=A0A8H3M6C9_9GLOM|nr:hypothetical protein GLOIN_2v1820807 [Rhizophagus clarus]